MVRVADERGRETLDVWVSENRLSGTPYTEYVVIVNGAQYDSMTMYTRGVGGLTWSQMTDVATGYREALEGYWSSD